MTKTMNWTRCTWLLIALASMLAVSVATSPGAAADDSDYVVSYGDTLSEIAEQYGLTLDQLIWMNGIADPNLIFPGERIVLEAAGNETVAEEPVYAEPVYEDEVVYDPSYGEWAQGGSGRPPPKSVSDRSTGEAPGGPAITPRDRSAPCLAPPTRWGSGG